MISDCFNKSLDDNDTFCRQNKNIKNILNNKKLKENQSNINSNNSKKINKKVKLKIYSVFVLVISVSLLFFFFENKNNKINEWFSNKIDKNKGKMKHAILLLSSYGVDYLNNFLHQFNNDSRYDIYIHLEGKSLIDFKKGETILKSNIKYCNFIHKSKRFSMAMVDAMYDIMSIANSKYNYDFYHFFSESCYLVKSLDYIYNYFEKNKLYSYVEHFLDNYNLYNNQSNVLYKGSQWMSINSNIVNKLLKRKDLYKKYKKEIEKGIIKIIDGAPDEFILQHIIIKDICKGTPQKCNVKYNNLRFVRWRNCNKEYCPNFLDVSNVSEEEINYISKKFLIIRKINYKNPKAIELINKIKNFSQ